MQTRIKELEASVTILEASLERKTDLCGQYQHTLEVQDHAISEMWEALDMYQLDPEQESQFLRDNIDMLVPSMQELISCMMALDSQRNL